MTERRIELVMLDIAGTSIDEGGAVYVALRTAVESHTGVPIPDDGSTGGRAQESARRSKDCSGQVTVGRRSTPSSPTSPASCSTRTGRRRLYRTAWHRGRLRRVARTRRQDRSPDRVFACDRRPAPGAGRLAGRPRHRCGDHQRPGAGKPSRAVPDLPRDGNRRSAKRSEVLVAGDTPNDLRAARTRGRSMSPESSPGPTTPRRCVPSRTRTS